MCGANQNAPPNPCQVCGSVADVASALKALLRTDKVKTGYTIIRVLQEGSLGFAFRGLKSNTQAEVVLKVPRGDGFAKEAFKNELGILRVINQRAPSLCMLEDCSDEDRQPYLVFKYLGGYSDQPDLFDNLVNHSNLMPEVARRISLELLCQPVLLHDSAGVIHRDLKPENLFVFRDGQV